MSDNITLPRKHIDYAAHALEHLIKNYNGSESFEVLVSEIIYHLRKALAAPVQPRCDGNHSGPRCDDPECWNDATAPRAHLAAEPQKQEAKQEPGLIEGLAELARQMKPLDADMAAILNANLDSLYIEDEPALAAERQKPSENIEALRRDAERYRWLQDAGQKYWMEFADMTAEATEAAIDAAMKEGT